MQTKTIAAGIVFAATAAAHAGPVLFDFEGTARGKNVKISVDGDTSNVFAGSIKHKIDGVLAYTFCIDPEQHTQRGVTNFEIDSFASSSLARDGWSAKAGIVAELAQIAGPDVWESNASKTRAAAFQVALWEVLVDFDGTAGSLSFSQGSFKSWNNDSVINAAEDMLDDLTFAGADASGLMAYTHESHQDFMGYAVPAPGVLALSGMGGIALLGNRRRR